MRLSLRSPSRLNTFAFATYMAPASITIPGTETCLKVSGYFRYDIGAGSGVRNNSITGIDANGVAFNVNRGAWGLPDVLDKKNPLNDDGSANFNGAWYKRSRFQLRVDARSE